MAGLLFIDTNILLDFYRAQGGQRGLSLLEHINDNHEKIITGNQVEMEYKKNRQRVILDSLNSFKTPDWGPLTPPAFLSQIQSIQTIGSRREEIDKLSKRVKGTIEGILKNPSRNDPIYKVCQRLFKSDCSTNLSRSNKDRLRVRKLAWKRFILGYPPRKNTDTSIGDAINWEWIIHCANQSGKDIVIVSRDSDYGIKYQKEPILNDWLVQEFKERVSRKRKITLTDKLAEGFKLISISVTKQEAEAERQLLSDIKTTHLEKPEFYNE